MFRIFRPEPGKRFSRFDLWLYQLFHWRWQAHFRAYPDLRADFLSHLQRYHDQQSKPRGRLALVSNNTSKVDTDPA